MNLKLKAILVDLFEESYNETDLLPVILSGGSGSRLWPLSRASYPKQYLNIDEKNKFSLLQNTYLRLRGIKNLKPPIIIFQMNGKDLLLPNK